jgi:hypothetical protein
VGGLSGAEAPGGRGAAGLTADVRRARVPVNLLTFAGTDRVLVQLPAGPSYRSAANPVTLWVASP